MSHAIGLRFYKIYVGKKGSPKTEIFKKGSASDVFGFLDSFITDCTKPQNEVTKQRAWFFEKLKSNSINVHHGLITYGTTGFESTLVDGRTRAKKYKRETSDMEEVPLYYHFWHPTGSDFVIAAFQSFSGRSCVNFVREKAKNQFEKENDGYSLRFQLLVAEQLGESKLGDAPVKEIRFLNKKVPADKFDEYLNGSKVDEVDCELVIRSKRRGYLGTYTDITKKLMTSGADGIFLIDEAPDLISTKLVLNGKYKTVGLQGPGGDAGLLDVTDEVDVQLSGHPKISSIENIVDELMLYFHESI